MAETSLYQTPHLQTSLTGPLQLLEKNFLSKEKIIENWFVQQWQQNPAPIYGSVDLRNSGFKLAPVDMNLFPAGFNNILLNPAFLALAIDAAKVAVNKVCANAKNILLIPESHTRNKFYWENVAALLQILTGAGFDVRVGFLGEHLEVSEVTVASGQVISLHPLQKVGQRISIADFIPDVILLNNDLSEGIPEILSGLTQPIVPPAELGWSLRLKSEHFHYYAQVCEQFAALLDIDPWFIAPLFKHCGHVDFMRRDANECLVSEVEELFAAIQKKYDQYNIPHKPYIVVKADSGTYGMAVMMIKNIEELYSLNRKQRTQMSKSKGGQPVTSVIIQEGVYTFETVQEDNAVAEPVVYLLGERVIGGFYRVHKDRGVDENLNSPGMHFEPLAFVKSCHQPQSNDHCQNRFYGYGVVARLSMLAAAKEMHALSKEVI